MRNYIFGKIKDGKLVIQKNSLEEIPKLEGKEVEIKKIDDSRSLKQNAFYWKVVNELTKYTGTEDWKWHTFFKFTFLHDKIKIMKLGGENQIVLPSTAELSISEMAKYLTDIVGDKTKPGWIRENYPEFMIPDPEEYYS